MHGCRSLRSQWKHEEQKSSGRLRQSVLTSAPNAPPCSWKCPSSSSTSCPQGIVYPRTEWSRVPVHRCRGFRKRHQDRLKRVHLVTQSALIGVQHVAQHCQRRESSGNTRRPLVSVRHVLSSQQCLRFSSTSHPQGMVCARAWLQGQWLGLVSAHGLLCCSQTCSSCGTTSCP